MKKCGFWIEGLGTERVLDKLSAAGVEVLSAEKPQKNGIIVWVDGKHRKKVFAILNSSCYNIKKVRFGGAERLMRTGLKLAGFAVGMALFFGIVVFMQSRVLKIEVVGSGSYYGAEVEEILLRHGTKPFSAAPKDKAKVCAEIMALPRVSYCSCQLSAGVFTVEVQVSDENIPLARQPLLSPADGTVETVTVVRGTPLVAAGDTVRKGQTVVDAVTAEGDPVIVIAQITVSFPVSQVYKLTEKEALAQAYLDYGEIGNLTATPCEGGTLIEGTARISAVLNLN